MPTSTSSAIRLSHAGPWLAACARFALYAWGAWFTVLLYEVVRLGPISNRTPGQLAYLGTLALGYSALCLPLLGLCHALRQLLLTRSRRADELICLLLSAALLPPSLGRARLLAGGAFLGSPYELPLQVAVCALCIATFVVIWLVHLALCLPDGALLFGKPRGPLRPKLRFAGFVLGALCAVAFAIAVNSRLRAYDFLVSLAMPGAWLFVASLWAGLLQRSRHRASWTGLHVACALGCVVYVFASPSATRHGQAELVRRAGLAAICEAARQLGPAPAFGNLSRASGRQSCPSAAPVPYGERLAVDRERRRNVILISVDALRKDALGRRVLDKPLTPALDAFAERSLAFSRAITPYPATLFALGAVLTGLYPSELLLGSDKLPDVLQLTAASWDHNVAIWPDTQFFGRSWLPPVLTRSLNLELASGAERQTDLMLAELRQARAARQRTFAWIHYFEPHLANESKQIDGSARERYDALVASVDQQFGRLMREIELLGYLEDSLILVFGDHGEALGELGYYGHHVYLNQFVSDVPLLLHAPGIAPGHSDQLASLIDIAPTLLDWTGTTAPRLGDARSLFEVAHSSDQRFILSEAFPVRFRLLFELVREPITTPAALEKQLVQVRGGNSGYQPKVALTGARERLIVNRVSGDEEFYTRDTDPHELDNLAPRDLPEQKRVRAALSAAMQRMSDRIFCRVGEP